MRKHLGMVLALTMTGALVSGCSSDDGASPGAATSTSPAPSTSSATSEAPSPTSGTASETSGSALPADAAEKYRQFEYGQPLATAKGQVSGKPATLEVLQVRSSAATTSLVLRVTVAERVGYGEGGVGTDLPASGFPDLVLVDEANKKVYRPGKARGKTLTEMWKPTLTSRNSLLLGPSPVYVHAVYAPIAEGVDSVSVRAGGFLDTKVTVSRI